MGTTLADFATRDLGIGDAGGSLLLLVMLIASLAVWKRILGSVSFRTIATKKAESFYWVAIMFSQTLGTALGDWTAEAQPDGFSGAAAVFGAMLLGIFALYRWSNLSRTALFWAAFILTRPLGAAVGDLLDKPTSAGGLALSRYGATGVLLAFIVVCLLVFPQRAADRSH